MGVKISQCIQRYLKFLTEQETKNIIPFLVRKGHKTYQDILLLRILFCTHRPAVCVDLEANLSLVSLGHHPSQKNKTPFTFCKMDERNFVESSWSEMSRSPYVLVTFSGDTNCSWWRGSCRLDCSSGYFFSGCAGMYARTAEEDKIYVSVMLFAKSMNCKLINLIFCRLQKGLF